ncbi:MAG: DUF2190 family protein [Puniceicoccales bacterium]|nr:DUF2190 family protein [Puniceicoccales bacterium]
MKKLILSNVAEGTHAGNITKVAAGPITQKYLLCKLDGGTGNVSIAGASDQPIGVATDEADANDFVNIALLGACDTVKMVASGAVQAGTIVIVDAGGKVRGLPVASGTYYQVGVALAGADTNGIVECVSCLPIKHVIAEQN